MAGSQGVHEQMEKNEKVLVIKDINLGHIFFSAVYYTSDTSTVAPELQSCLLPVLCKPFNCLYWHFIV